MGGGGYHHLIDYSPFLPSFDPAFHHALFDVLFRGGDFVGAGGKEFSHKFYVAHLEAGDQLLVKNPFVFRDEVSYSVQDLARVVDH